MESKNKIFLLNSLNEILYQFEIDELELAYQKAEELELFGIEVNLQKPSLPESLGNSLGVLSKKAKSDLEAELIDEISSHESCCYK